MRQLKFRVWTGSTMECRVVAGALGVFYVEGLDPKDSASMSSFNTKYSEQTPVMQSTGLHDRNGKEIYEDDILKAGRDVIRVFWHSEFSSFSLYKKEWLSSHFFGEALDPEDCEVIGNIYENPELVEVPHD